MMMSKSRIEAFSDGVIAIAITLLVLDIHVPSPASPSGLGHQIAREWPSYAAYVVSFLSIGVIWINHHAMLRRLVAVDHPVLMLNLLLLLTIGVLPWSTALMANFLRASSGQHLAAAIYAGSFLVMAIAFIAVQAYAMARPRSAATPPRRRRATVDQPPQSSRVGALHPRGRGGRHLLVSDPGHLRRRRRVLRAPPDHRGFRARGDALAGAPQATTASSSAGHAGSSHTGHHHRTSNAEPQAPWRGGSDGSRPSRRAAQSASSRSASASVLGAGNERQLQVVPRELTA